ncbi:hypothetical protein ACGF1Z_19625 [Streptomyces sp. NPDC048018]|uniref:hypothetical protein n=1 Tax=Streptomyces sp. NPDC048018 TaxID=3365499 RepID=UPI003720336B
MSEQTTPTPGAAAPPAVPAVDGGTPVTAVAGPDAVVPAPRRPRRLFPYVLGGVLLLGVAAGGTYTGVTVAGADRHAPTFGWEEPVADGESKDPAADTALRGRTSTPLSKLLLPVPDGYVLGPDVEQYGNDGELSSRDATALLKQQGKGLAGKKRREFDQRIEKLGIQGIAVRSYASDAVVVDVQIVQMKDKRFGTEMRRMQSEIARLLKLPKGPRIEGHRDVSCFGMPKPKDDDEAEDDGDSGVDGMVCSASESDYYVSVHASGSRPFDRTAVAALVKKQLDHIKSPGEYV